MPGRRRRPGAGTPAAAPGAAGDAAWFVPVVRELEEMRYQFVRPFVLDSSAFTATFGTTPTPLEQTWEQTIAWWRRHLA